MTRESLLWGLLLLAVPFVCLAAATGSLTLAFIAMALGMIVLGMNDYDRRKRARDRHWWPPE